MYIYVTISCPEMKSGMAEKGGNCSKICCRTTKKVVTFFIATISPLPPSPFFYPPLLLFLLPFSHHLPPTLSTFPNSLRQRYLFLQLVKFHKI